MKHGETPRYVFHVPPEYIAGRRHCVVCDVWFAAGQRHECGNSAAVDLPAKFPLSIPLQGVASVDRYPGEAGCG